MKIHCLKHTGVSESLLGLGLSYGLTSEYDKWEDVPEDVQERVASVAKKLAGKGGGEDKFLRQIIFWWDIVAPSYWWPQFDQYKISTTTQSESKMHSLTKREFTPDDFEIEHLAGYRKVAKQFFPEIDEDAEVWSEVPGYPEILASNQGRVKRLAFISSHNRHYRERILPNVVQKDGYVHSVYRYSGKTIQVGTHRLVALAFIANPENKKEVNHKDGNKLNNKAENLEWSTRKENIDHSIEKNLQPSNIGGYAGKLSKEERQEVLARWSNGETMRSIARSFGVSHTLISSLVRGRYKYLPPKKSEFNEFCKLCIEPLNELRQVYLDTKDKEVWMQILNNLPQGYRQRRIVSLSLAQMLNIYRQRKSHRLQEWRQVCDAFVKHTPYLFRGMFD